MLDVMRTITIEAVDRAFREYCKVADALLEEVPFGGKVVVFGGDLRQVLPVVQKGSRDNIVDQYIKCSSLWRHVTSLQLEDNMRVLRAVGEEAAVLDKFSKYLLRIGDGSEPTIGGTEFDVAIDPCMALPNGSNLNKLYEAVYHNFSGSVFSNNMGTFLTSRAVLTSNNADANNVNDYLINDFDKEMNPSIIHLYSADALESQDEQIQLSYPVEYLNSINYGGIPPHHLKLKVGCPIMLFRNLDSSNGLCNGTRLLCLNIQLRIITAKIVTGKYYITKYNRYT